MKAGHAFSSLLASKDERRYIFGGVNLRRPGYALQFALTNGLRELSTNVGVWYMREGVSHCVLQVLLRLIGIVSGHLAWA